MYTKRVQIVNYGPIEKLDIKFPFDDGAPKPIVLVGENGSGKSILLSLVVNGLISAKDAIYPDSPEVDSGKVYKLRSGSYIRAGTGFYFGRVDFEQEFYVAEMRSERLRREYDDFPAGPRDPDILDAWNKMAPERVDYYDSNFSERIKLEGIFGNKCVLYFPPNRFEDPAWLNEGNLRSRAEFLDSRNIQGETNRRLIAYSPLLENQNWLFGVIFDQAAFEMQTRSVSIPIEGVPQAIPFPIFQGYSGDATGTYEVALRIVQNVTNVDDARFGIGKRLNRVISIESNDGQIVPNIFQLSSGETSLLNLFLSILRDFNLSGTNFTSAEEVQGVVVVDEIDLHLHAVQQYEVLPRLIRMFPKVQFIVTTHSPLFVLGMNKVYGENGFALYRLPEGGQISPEEFSEFGDAYFAFAETRTFSDDMRKLIEEAQKPIVFVEGKTDLKYIERAAELLGKEALLEDLELRDGGGKGKLIKIWKDSVLPLTELLPQQVLLLFDCDEERPPEKKGKLIQRTIPLQSQNPVGKGIENLFRKPTLEAALQNGKFFLTEEQHGATDEDGQPVTVPEKWTVIDSAKSSLCDWLCENGTHKDFKPFQVVFDLIEEALESSFSGECATIQ